VDIRHIYSFPESLGGLCAFFDDKSAFLAEMTPFEDVFYLKKPLYGDFITRGLTERGEGGFLSEISL